MCGSVRARREGKGGGGNGGEDRCSHMFKALTLFRTAQRCTTTTTNNIIIIIIINNTLAVRQLRK